MVACFDLGVAAPARAPALAPVHVEASFYPGVILDGLDRPPQPLFA